MAMNLLYILFAILGLSFLIFIHELGHYWMARREGMRVEKFAIGFGRPLFKWKRDGVEWQIGWLLFGGFVKIAGTDTSDGKDLYKVKGGFFGSSPLARIKVAFMGPFVNLVFALILFSLLWGLGGREKPFSEFTHLIGWIDPQSALYQQGVRPGDEITAYNERSFKNQKDHFLAPLIEGSPLNVHGMEVNYETHQKTPFTYTISPYLYGFQGGARVQTTGILAPASYVMYNRINGKENPLPEGSPLAGSGIQYGDRILWVDGTLIFSNFQLNQVLNDHRILLTIEREGTRLLRRVPVVHFNAFRPNYQVKEEIIDWQYAAGLNTLSQDALLVLPYNITPDGVVEHKLTLLDQEDEKKLFPQVPFSEETTSLQEGDRILAVQGIPVTRAHEILKNIQNKTVHIIIERNPSLTQIVDWNQEDLLFNQEIDWKALYELASSIGSNKQYTQEDHLILLPPITPLPQLDFPLSPQTKAEFLSYFAEKKREIEQIDDMEQREQLLELLNKAKETKILGLPNPQDRTVQYNPLPTTLFSDVSDEIGRTLVGLFSGSLSPKHLSGPVGIIQVVQSKSMVSLKEALFWLAAISLNLGILNLLPIPVLDGGSILISLFELVTGKRLPPKTLEKIVFVFALLLISLFVFLTYNDLLRIVGG